MTKLTVKDLKAALVNVPDNAQVVFQGNIPGEEEIEGVDDPTYTVCTGHLYSAFDRESGQTPEFVLDCAITNSEGGIL